MMGRLSLLNVVALHACYGGGWLETRIVTVTLDMPSGLGVRELGVQGCT